MRLITKVIGFFAIFTAIACGDDQPQFIQNFAYDITENTVTLEAEFSSNVSLNTDFRVPILKYGEVAMVANDDQHGFRLKTTLNLGALVDPDIVHLLRTRRLPNNQPMSSYVKSDLGRLKIKASDDIATSVYFGLNPDQFYLGTSVELNFIDQHFPAGLILSQRLRDTRGRMLAVVSLYGPQISPAGEMTAPGGIFVVSNISDLKRYLEESAGAGQRVRLKPEKATWVNQKKFKSMTAQYKLFQLYKKSGKRAGYVD